MALLFGVGHTLGYPWVGDVSDQQFDQISAVKSITVITQGFLRSYWDFHIGFGVTLSLLFLVQAIVFWQLGALEQDEPRSARFIAAVFGVFYAICTIVNLMFFFCAPIVCSAILSACLITASVRTRPGSIRGGQNSVARAPNAAKGRAPGRTANAPISQLSPASMRTSGIHRRERDGWSTGTPWGRSRQNIRTTTRRRSSTLWRSRPLNRGCVLSLPLGVGDIELRFTQIESALDSAPRFIFEFPIAIKIVDPPSFRCNQDTVELLVQPIPAVLTVAAVLDMLESVAQARA